MAISIVNTHINYTVKLSTEEIYTTVTANPGVVTEWIEDNIKHPHGHGGIIVGLDAEWRATFSSQVISPVATLQLCVRDRCLVYQILNSNNPMPQSLADFLSPENNFIYFVGVGIKEDLDKLQRDYGVGGGARYVDLRGYAAEEYGRKELKTTGLKGLATFVLGMEVDKPREVTMSRWDQRCLTPDQVKYATVDAYVSFQIGRALGLDHFAIQKCLESITGRFDNLLFRGESSY